MDMINTDTPNTPVDDLHCFPSSAYKEANRQAN